MSFDINEILNEYRYKTELHAHTNPASSCADFSPEETVKKYAAHGVDALVITNHINPEMKSGEKYLADYYHAREAGEKYGVNVILGVEIRFCEARNDYLVYGVAEDEVQTMIDLVPHGLCEFYRQIKNEKNVILQAHPFRDGLRRADVSLLDGIEVFNLHPGHNGRVGLAAEFAKKHDLLTICGSDFHHSGHEATALIRTNKKPSNSFEIAQIIKSKDYLFDIAGNIVFPYAGR